MYFMLNFRNNIFGGIVLENEKKNEDTVIDKIEKMGSSEMGDGKHKIFCLTIIGEIEGHNVLPEQSKTTKY